MITYQFPPLKGTHFCSWTICMMQIYQKWKWVLFRGRKWATTAFQYSYTNLTNLTYVISKMEMNTLAFHFWTICMPWIFDQSVLCAYVFLWMILSIFDQRYFSYNPPPSQQTHESSSPPLPVSDDDFDEVWGRYVHAHGLILLAGFHINERGDIKPYTGTSYHVLVAQLVEAQGFYWIIKMTKFHFSRGR